MGGGRLFEVLVEPEGGVQYYPWVGTGCGGYESGALKDNGIVLKLL